MPQKTSTKLTFLSPKKTVLRLWLMSFQRVLKLLWKYLLVKEEEFSTDQSVQISPCRFICEREESGCYMQLISGSK